MEWVVVGIECGLEGRGSVESITAKMSSKDSPTHTHTHTHERHTCTPAPVRPPMSGPVPLALWAAATLEVPWTSNLVVSNRFMRKLVESNPYLSQSSCLKSMDQPRFLTGPPHFPPNLRPARPVVCAGGGAPAGRWRASELALPDFSRLYSLSSSLDLFTIVNHQSPTPHPSCRPQSR